jgi:hypothetical protein
MTLVEIAAVVAVLLTAGVVVSVIVLLIKDPTTISAVHKPSPGLLHATRLELPSRPIN